MSATFDRTWIWHPSFTETQTDTAGLFVHFRRQFTIEKEPPRSLKIHITADTRYKLYVNGQLVSLGPVKGDQHLWFYDEVDIGPFLKQGFNHIGVHVLRFFYSTQYAPAIPRLATGGMRLTLPDGPDCWSEQLCSSTLWECAVDPAARLRIDEPEDSFLHVYEFHKVDEPSSSLRWVPARVLELKNSTGNAPPWNLSPRLIPKYWVQDVWFSKIHNVQSEVSVDAWSKLLLGPDSGDSASELCLVPGSTHTIELEMDNHTTGFICARFKRPSQGGGHVKLTYSESYEDEPELYVGIRRKGHRCDTTKQIFGPHDLYQFQGPNVRQLGYHHDEDTEEIFAPFHLRTFRFIKLEISVGETDLVFQGIKAESATYPLDVHARIATGPESPLVEKLWDTSLRTLINCMHDCYEDCPFYEQLQYAMDTRSAILYTYFTSGDDALARQAIIQMHNSFQPRVGLTTSRAPTNRPQFIPHFSLYWIGMLNDHLDHFGDTVFVGQFVAVADAVLSYFEARVDPQLQLVRWERRAGIWNYVDWTMEWRPYGCPPVCERTGISTFTNEMYAYTLRAAAKLLEKLGRPGVADEYRKRADRTVAALQQHCFDGEFFTDSLASSQFEQGPRSQHSQVWAVLCGAVSGTQAQELLRKSIQRTQAGEFVQESVSMSFYTLRALSLAGGTVYDDHFPQFWKPWVNQLELGLTTWVEDSIAQRSDCHAWGSVPLHEFMAEVAGVSPAEPGWKTISIRPRLKLYPNLDATVPLGRVDGELAGSVRVMWSTDGKSGDIHLRIKLNMAGRRVVRLRIYIPGQEISLEADELDIEFVVEA